MNFVTVLKKILRKKVSDEISREKDAKEVKAVFSGQSEVRLVDRGKIIRRTRFL